MATSLLVDLTKCGIGSVAVARGGQAAITVRQRRIEQFSDAALGASAIDTVLTEILCRIQAQDPLSITSVLALSGTQSVVVGGRRANAATYSDATLLHCVLTGFGLDIADRQPGTVSYDLQNRATAGNTLVDELSWASGTLQAIATRKGLIRILETGTTFTDDNAGELDLPGMERITYQATGQVIVDQSGDEVLADIVDVAGYAISGSITLRDTTVGSSQVRGEALSELRRGDLAVAVRPSHQSDGASAPSDMVLTFKRLKFHSPSTTLNTKAPGTTQVPFDAVLVSSANATLALSAMITAA